MVKSDNQSSTYTNAEMTLASWMTLVCLVHALDVQTQERFRVEIAKSLEQFLDPLQLGDSSETRAYADLSKVRQLLRMHIDRP